MFELKHECITSCVPDQLSNGFGNRVQVRHLHLQAERKHRSHEAEVQAYQHDWQQHVLRLKDYFERQGLQNVHPSGLHVTSEMYCMVHLLGPVMGMGCHPQAEHMQAYACRCCGALCLHT